MLGAEFCVLPGVHAEGEHVPCNSGGIKRETPLSLKQGSTAEISAAAAVAANDRSIGIGTPRLPSDKHSLAGNWAVSLAQVSAGIL